MSPLAVTGEPGVTRYEPSGVLTPDIMLDRALTSGASAETLERLFALKERVDASNAKRAFDAAVSEAKSKIGTVSKNRTVDFTGKTQVRTSYKHEDFAEVARTVDRVLGEHGLSYRFGTKQGDGGRITVTCILAHRDGHSEETSLSASPDDSGNKNNIQAIGSTITYLQRYTLKAALGLAASNDDDGRAAGDGGVISEDEASEILTALAETGSNLAAFCGLFKVADVHEIRASDLNRARDMIKHKRAALAKRGAQ